MNPRLTSFIALVALVGLTLATWQLADGGASPWVLGTVAMAKVIVIGAVFLELPRSWPGWAALYGSGALVVLGLSAFFISGAV